MKDQKLRGFGLYREIKKIDSKVKVCFLTAGEIKCGAVIDDIFSDLKENQFIQKPIENEELIKIINGIITSKYTISHK
jgi:two-component SAPR family response regulator